MPNYVPGIGPFNPDLMIIAEAPGQYEDEQLEPLVGPTGQLVNEALFKAGLSRNEVYLTNVVKYRPPLNDFSKLDLIGVSLEKSIEELWVEINRVNPKCILTLGDHALDAVCGVRGVLNYRGSILRAKDGVHKVVCTIHPAALFSHTNKKGLPYIYKKLIEFDFVRAVEESKSNVISTPDRYLHVANNSLDTYKFFSQYEKLEKCTVDIESVGCIPVCVGFAFNHYDAISIPLLKRRGRVELTTMSERELISCYRMIDEVLRTKKLMGHNLKYDHFKLSRLGFQLNNIYSDTLIKLRVVFPELPTKGLATATSLWTREPYYKPEGKEFKLGKSPLSQLFLYNAKDCAVNFEVDTALDKDLDALSELYSVPLREYFYEYQMKKHHVYLEMENNGFNVDLERQAYLKAKYIGLREVAHKHLVELIGHDTNVKSPPKIFELLYKELGFPAYKEAPTAEDALIKLLGNHCKGKDGPKKAAILEGILEERRIRDQYSRYINFTPDYDDRCRTSFNIISTETCRSSTSNPAKPIRPENSGLAFHTISKHGRLAKDIRSMFIPDKGKLFLQADASTAEPRVVAVLCKDWELLSAFDTVDIHRRTAALILGLTPTLDLSPGTHLSDVLGKDSPERFSGKKTRNGGNYDMKKRRFMTEFNTDAQKFEIGMSISEWKGGQMLDLFHAASPRIKSIFHREIQEHITEHRVLIDPMGGVRIFNGEMNDSLFQEAYANLPQRTIGHLVQGALIKCHEELGDEVGSIGSGRPVNLISENHDSLLWQVPEKDYEKYSSLMRKHMTTPIDFSRYCSLKRDYILTIPCDVEISDRTYGDLDKISKFKPKLIEVEQIEVVSIQDRMKGLRG